MEIGYFGWIWRRSLFSSKQSTSQSRFFFFSFLLQKMYQISHKIHGQILVFIDREKKGFPNHMQWTLLDTALIFFLLWNYFMQNLIILSAYLLSCRQQDPSLPIFSFVVCILKEAAVSFGACNFHHGKDLEVLLTNVWCVIISRFL